MEELRTRYRAYREYREKLENDDAHRTLIRALQSAALGKEACNGSLSRCVLEEDWIRAVEENLPYVERALDEQRRFIESNEEIRRVDQAKKISVETIRHLAQHSNMISHIDGDDVVPERVLIVERDDNYAIYENRFLFTLVQRIQAFLDERYNAVAGLNGAAAFSYMTEREAVWNRRHLKATVSISCEQQADKVRTRDASAEMTGMERLAVLRQRAGDLASAPLMRLLKGVSLVSSPIVRTNVFKKNPNFSKALELFEFLEGYRKPGYEIVVDAPEAVKLSESLRRGVCEAIALEELLGRLDSDKALAELLEADFLCQNELAEQERIRKEEERERQVQARIFAAREEEIAIREAEIAKREAVISDQQRTIGGLSARVHALDAHNVALEAQLKETTETLNAARSEVVGLNDELRQSGERMRAERRAHEQYVDELRREFEIEQARLQECLDASEVENCELQRTAAQEKRRCDDLQDQLERAREDLEQLDMLKRKLSRARSEIRKLKQGLQPEASRGLRGLFVKRKPNSER